MNSPACSPECRLVFPVAFDIPTELRLPKGLVAGRSTTPRAIVAMPEATVHKYHRVVTRENNIRRAGEVFCVDSKSEALSEQPGAYILLGYRIPALYGSHHSRALFSAYTVGH